MVPYVVHVMQQAPGLPRTFPPQMIRAIATNLAIQDLVFTAVTAPMGLWLGSRVGLGAPLLSQWLGAEPAPRRDLRSGLALATSAGISVGVIVMLFHFFIARLVTASPELANPPAWSGLLASFGASIREEIWLRLGIMSLLVWLAAAVGRQLVPARGLVWSANVIAALAYGALHLPQVGTFMELTPVVVAYVLLINAVGGIAYGWLYWRHSLVAAMLAHFIADVVMKVVRPAIIS